MNAIFLAVSVLFDEISSDRNAFCWEFVLTGFCSDELKSDYR